MRQQVHVESGFGYGVVGADLHVFADRGPVYLLLGHRPAPTPDTAWLLAQPSRLLDARYAVVDFTGRGAEMAQLLAWRETGTRLTARWLHGPGGQGKTRLANEFARQSAAAGWKVVTAVHGAGTIWSPPGSEDLRLGDAVGLLVVVDYADRWPRSDLAWLFSNVLLHQPVPTRLLLVARSIDPWPLVRADLHRQQADTSDQALRTLPHERERMYTAARDAFAARYGSSQAAPIPPAGLLEDPEYGLTLAIHLAALVSVDATAHSRPYPSDMAGLTAYLLDREREHWAKLYANSAHGSDFRTPPSVMARAVHLAVLTGSVPHREGKSILGRLDLGGHPERVLSDHAICYPPMNPRQGAVLEPLYPDRLAEDFLALMLHGHDLDSRPADPWAATATTDVLASTADDVPSGFLARAITFMAAAARRWPHVGDGHLYPLLRDNPRHAVSAGGAALTSLAQLPTIPLGLLEAIESELPERRDVDLDVGIAAVASRLAAERLAGDLDIVDRLRIRWELSNLLSNAGRDQEALGMAEEAVAIARRLVAGDGTGFEPDLAGSLSTLGGALSTLGRWEEALDAATEAVAVQRRLAAQSPATFGPELATALHNLSISLAGAGLRQEALEAAEEAVRMRRRPGFADDEAHVAGSLDNLRLRLLEVGRLDEALALAEEAVLAHRDLAAANPAAFGPDLARVLSNHSVILTKVERHEDAVAAAEEAVRICRGLVVANQAVFEVDLATSLTNLGNARSAWGERDEAWEITNEAAEILRRLVQGNAGLEANLALALSNLGKQLSDVGQQEAALVVTQEAVEIRRRLAEGNPAAHRPGLATSLDHLGKRLLAAGRAWEGLAASEEAVEVRRSLAADDPGAFAADLANALTNQGALRWGLGQRQEALDVTAEAIEIRRQLAADVQSAGASDLAASLTNLSGMLSGLGRLDQALALATEAVTLCRRQAETHPAAAPGLSASLANLGLVLALAGRQSEALAATQEAVIIRRRLAVDSPAVFEPELAAALTNLSADLMAFHRRDEALATAEEAVDIHRRLAEANPARFASGLATSLTNLCITLWLADRREAALRAGAESVEVYRNLALESPEAHIDDLRRAQALVADLRSRLTG
ncbi:tetratricopeptide repeat protein [Catellatospora paridis]|uniref:tetratricopeptide repeat protein n=1 Tax=Catellatospora paridis TaxID=1617086 RepID=UPI0012D37A24|nr:tetratricopeptide repeat protein [Catellatospora paridis]